MVTPPKARRGMRTAKGAGLKLNRKTRNALAKLHNLGHPLYERLARMLINDGANKDLIEGPKGLRCMVFERLQAVQSNEQTSHEQQEPARCPWRSVGRHFRAAESRTSRCGHGVPRPLLLRVLHHGHPHRRRATLG